MLFVVVVVGGGRGGVLVVAVVVVVVCGACGMWRVAWLRWLVDADVGDNGTCHMRPWNVKPMNAALCGLRSRNYCYLWDVGLLI